VVKLAEYVLWLEREHFRAKPIPLAARKKDGWYERRLAWVFELIEMFGVDLIAVTREMELTNTYESRAEVLEKGTCAAHFKEAFSLVRGSKE